MTLEFDPYMLLGISDQASEDEVKRAYRRLAQRLHPDVNADNPSAEQQFNDVTTAYNLLVDRTRRREYDQAAATRAENGDTYFTMRVTPSKRALSPLPEEQVIYLLAEIFPAPQAEGETAGDFPMNLTLVLDHSKSMEGTRLDRVKVAAQKIIEELDENDVLSVVIFNDRATVIIPSTKVEDKASLRARVSMMSAMGGTEIFQGLSAGVTQNRVQMGPRMINHVILLTDGHTFGDQERCLELAKKAGEEGIGISAMGLGNDWNDDFLDRLTSLTGGGTTYVDSASVVVQFMNEHVRNLSNSFAERMKLSVAPDSDVQLDMAFKLMPNPQPLAVEDGIIPLASLPVKRPISVLMQFLMPANMTTGFRTVARLVAQGDILQNHVQAYQAVSDISLEITEKLTTDEPPAVIMDALSKLTLYRLQESAKDALERGDIDEATRRLENLATRLLELGETSLAHQTLSEAQYIAHTNSLSDKGSKAIKYQTRALLGAGSLEAMLSSYLTSEHDDNP